MRAASAGAAVARARYNTGSRSTADRGLDFTTEADVETERAIRDVLAELRPGDAIVGEELGSSGDGPAGGWSIRSAARSTSLPACPCSP